ncbi:hypothetical protein ACHAPJ_010255 [Fusarium lateritium]
MHFQSITLAAALVNAVAAIRCSEIGWSTGENGVTPSGLDPFDPQGRWEVVPASKCWVRFQSYKEGEDPVSARVTKTLFEATGSQVRHTIDNYQGSPGNIMLWLPLKTKSFQYANILPAKIGKDFEEVQGQGSIVAGRTILSIILPSGMEKLTVVPPDAPDTQSKYDANRKMSDSVSITGYAGTISKDDWAYTTAAEVQLLLYGIFETQFRGYYERRAPDMHAAWLTAEKEDPNECVVIDFRDFEKMVLGTRRPDT